MLLFILVIARVSGTIYVTERVLSLLPTFDISSDVEPIGIAEGRLISMTMTFDLSGSRRATATDRFWAIGLSAHVTAESGQTVGYIRQELLAILPRYRILDANKKPLAVADMNWLETDFQVRSTRTGLLCATVTRSLFRLRDSWSISGSCPELDDRLLIFLSIFQTAMDNEEYGRRRSTAKS